MASRNSDPSCSLRTIALVITIVVGLITILAFFGVNQFTDLFDKSTEQPSSTTTASIAFPQNGATVGESVVVKGSISGLKSGQRAFLCLKSQAFGRLIYPQGEIVPDATGNWSVTSIYYSIGYKYETYVVVADDPIAVQVLADGNYRANGMSSLPPNTSIISPVIVVTRK